MGRDNTLATAVIELTKGMVDEFDILDFMQSVTARTAGVFEGATTVLLLSDLRGALQMAAASGHVRADSQLVRLSDGPSRQALLRGEPVTHGSLGASGSWPATAATAAELGLQYVAAAPLRLRDRELGALVILLAEEPADRQRRFRALEALAGIATVGLLQQHTPRQRELLAEQLQSALDLRIVLDQATGMVAELAGVPVVAALTLLEEHARRSGRRLGAVARAVVEGRLGAADLVEGPTPGPDR